MKILFVLPHFFKPQTKAKHASLKNNPNLRIEGLNFSINAIHQLFGKAQCMIHIANLCTLPVNRTNEYDIDIVICTTNNDHLLNILPIPEHLYKHHNTNSEPLLLGFECQKVLSENLGKYDYYCYLEEDLILHDPLFFEKLKWFNSEYDKTCLLQPNRYEISPIISIVHKAYIDGDLRPDITSKFQDVSQDPELNNKIMNMPLTFKRTLNPHSGAYFLTNEQLEYWTKQEYFLDKDISFISPLESAATLGVMKTFKIYKPAPICANFLEIQHFGAAFLTLIGRTVKF